MGLYRKKRPTKHLKPLIAGGKELKKKGATLKHVLFYLEVKKDEDFKLKPLTVGLRR